MTKSELLNHPIRKFIVENVRDHPSDITRFTSEELDVTRQAVHRHINKLIKADIIRFEGTTKDRKYELAPLAETEFVIKTNQSPREDEIWRNNVRDLLIELPKNILSICQYGFTEILNNAVEHAEGENIHIYVRVDHDQILFMISDDGIGIFNKITTELGLSDRRFAILELTKGKLTTDPAKHTGEGIFFTSRIFDEFSILSSNLFFSHKSKGDDWLIESEDSDDGTSVVMKISASSNKELQGIFDKFTADEDEYSFSRTHVPVALAKYGEENLVSRSQARRLLSRFDRFKEVLLNFEGIDTIGQAFADEIFRVFANENPDIELIHVLANEQVVKMINRAKSRQKEGKENK